MKRLTTIPRWVTCSVTALVAVGSVAALYPGGLASAYEDIRDAKSLRGLVAETEQIDKDLSGQIVNMRERVEYKEELISTLVRGEATLSSVTDEFAALNRNDDVILQVQRRRYGDLELTELAARNVIEFTQIRLKHDHHHGSSAVMNRLRAEYEQRFGHPPRGV